MGEGGAALEESLIGRATPAATRLRFNGDAAVTQRFWYRPSHVTSGRQRLPSWALHVRTVVFARDFEPRERAPRVRMRAVTRAWLRPCRIRTYTDSELRRSRSALRACAVSRCRCLRREHLSFSRS